MGIEMEVSQKGVEFDNVSLGTLCRVMLSCSIIGSAAGMYGGLQLGASLFTKTDEDKKKAKQVSKFASYAVAGLSTMTILYLFHTHSNHHRRHHHHRR
eukprot:TRINITY_DN10766_c0_g1_i1.p1 TRINITY_DN10766_c0_g1~~TRINITY_DN10766_c0_g1_i1.p1  ORF type:complete len:114 (+),score=31.32 TRINITY_DN10766_c0_g1_i1:51-344(+)